MKETELIQFISDFIRKYHTAAIDAILFNTNCCQSEELQALEDECRAIFQRFLELLN